MTLIVSLRIPDGIVIAGDSLATMTTNLQPQANIDVECPKCKTQHTAVATLPPINIPATTLSFAQKVFPFLDTCGVGVTGIGQLAGKTIYFAARELESSLFENGKTKAAVKEEYASVHLVAEALSNHLQALVVEQVSSEGVDIADMPDDWRPLSLQVIGYEQDVATTVEVQLGKVVKSKIHQGSGFTVTGKTNVVEALFNLYQANPNERPLVDVFSLKMLLSIPNSLLVLLQNTSSFRGQSLTSVVTST